MEPGQPATDRLPDSLGMLRQWWWVVAIGVLFGVAASAGWLQTRLPVWEATTSVLVRPAGLDTNVVGGRTQGEVNLDTEAQLVRSTAVAADVASRLAGTGGAAADQAAPGAPVPATASPSDQAAAGQATAEPAGQAVAGEPASQVAIQPAATPDELAGRVRVEVPANTSVLAITFAAGTPAEAQAGSRAFAEAYLRHRERAARTELRSQRDSIEARLEELDISLTRIGERLAATPPNSPAIADLESQREAVNAQVTDLTDRLNAVATATVSGGEIINEPRLPTEPSSPRPGIALASGAALGLVLGLGAAAGCDRLARRVRRPADLSRRLGVPVLATLDHAGAEEVASPYTHAGRTFDRLRNELTGGTSGNVIAVTSPTAGPATRHAAVNLAASLSRCGHDVVLVAAGAAVEVPLGVTPGAGLSELLAGRANLPDALQRAPRFPRLRVMTLGATATAAGLLQSPGMRTVLRMLATRAGYVVVEAPPTAASADAQSLAGHADIALLVVERGRARLGEVADAAEQLRRAPLLGALLVQAGRRPGKDKGYEQPPASGNEPAGGRRPALRPRPGGNATSPLPDTEARTLLMTRLDGEAAR